MTQPTDPRASNGADRAASTNTPGAPRPRQDTVLLSDVPDAETLLADNTPADRATHTPAPNRTDLNLTAATLAALGQRYDILSEAGHGSMGNVYKARDRETGETVALKLLKPEIASDQQMMDRFKNELLFARKITHKNVCRVHEFNRLGSVAYTSMEFVEGESLRSVLNRFGGLPTRKGIDLAQQICSGLKEAHAQGIVHRDLKPENVMIDGRGNVKIMDFGIARSMESLTRMTGAMVGTPAYMAPEQVGGKPVDYRTDIYSLGLILYEIFTGTQAFTAESAVAVAMKQLRESPAPPHEIEPGIPVSIERAILKCVEKDPAKRFQSVAEIERVFTSSIGSGAGIGSTTAGRSTQDALAMRPTIGMSTTAAGAPTLRIAAQQKSSRGKWIAAVIFVAFAALFAGGAARWAKNARLADKLPPPPRPSAPTLPDFALQQPAPSTPATSTVGARSETATPAAPGNSETADQSSNASITAAATPAITAVAQPTAVAAARSKPASNVSAPTASLPPAAPSLDPARHANAASKQPVPAATPTQTTSDAAQTATPPTGSVLNGQGPSYIWVARYDLEDRAQDVSRTIQGLGFASHVMPRRGENGRQFFTVIMGPVPPAQIPSTIDWLKTQGYPDVREVKGPALGQLNGRGRNMRSQPASGGNSE
jgi:serine/threonine protein kinase